MSYNKLIKYCTKILFTIIALTTCINFVNAHEKDHSSKLHIEDHENISRPNYYPEYYDDEGQLVFKIRGLFALGEGKHKKFPERRNKNSTASFADLLKQGVGIDTSMSIFFMDYLAAEFSLGYMYHGGKNGALKSALDLHGANTQNKNTNAKEIHMVPLTLTLQMHVAPFGGIRPYVGGGYSYMYMYSRSNSYKLSSDHGFVAQAGIDFVLRNDTVMNLDVKKYILEPKISYKNNFLGTTNGVNGHLKFEPLVISAGIGFKL